ncbi:hypothetical protein HNP86_001821 [Methanococcus maripaludis]|uniref:Uncharacterized protein n=1 Tax=Methanococcus maripaludis TaxID=39152 RepID=A0A7J9NVF4_METMI|nr:hypothetical protein [Methanococcus maripaludis]MBA2851662.1 hypothetical protein [Methanococcus maripaludis]
MVTLDDLNDMWSNGVYNNLREYELHHIVKLDKDVEITARNGTLIKFNTFVVDNTKFKAINSSYIKYNNAGFDYATLLTAYPEYTDLVYDLFQVILKSKSDDGLHLVDTYANDEIKRIMGFVDKVNKTEKLVRAADVLNNEWKFKHLIANDDGKITLNELWGKFSYYTLDVINQYKENIRPYLIFGKTYTYTVMHKYRRGDVSTYNVAYHAIDDDLDWLMSEYNRVSALLTQKVITID